MRNAWQWLLLLRRWLTSDGMMSVRRVSGRRRPGGHLVRWWRRRCRMQRVLRRSWRCGLRSIRRVRRTSARCKRREHMTHWRTIWTTLSLSGPRTHTHTHMAMRTRVRPIRRSEIGKIGTHQKIGESDMCTVRFRFACGRRAACQIN